DTMTGDNKTVWDKPENLARTILIPTVGVESVEFNISDEKSIKLFKSGYRSAQEFI
ncbi:MAG TPA: phospholipase, partial [Clostridiaceae bacterium]|nr:phospholipase [Clostridiaceae bacterium]